MKKQAKKKLENELSAVIEQVLSKLDSKAITRTRKVIRQTAKAVVKKFSKTIKSIASKNEPLKKKAPSSKKAVVKKSVAIKPAVSKNAKTRPAIHTTDMSPAVSLPVQLSEGAGA